MSELEAAYDLIVIGAGAAGMTVAVVAAAEGLSVLLLEKTAMVGGTTAWSGGMVWVPGNRHTAVAGRPDTLDAARHYLAATVPGGCEASNLDAFVTRADEAVAWLEAHTPVQFRPVAKYPDYYPDRPGATEGGRVLEPCPFDAMQLGADFALLRPPLPEFTLFGGMMVSRPDIAHFRRMFRSGRSALRVARLLAGYLWQRRRAPRGTTLYLGNALAGRLLLAVRRAGVALHTKANVTALEGNERGITGVVLEPDGARQVVRARCGVVLAAGGFSHDPALRRAQLPAAAGDLSASAPGSTGDGTRLGIAAGGQLGLHNADNAFWVPVSRFRRADGRVGVFPHTVTDRAKPGLIAVDRSGRRFVNEAISYHDFVRGMFRAEHAGAGPAYLVCDARFLWRYGLGRVKPLRLSLRGAIRRGDIASAPTPRGLAQAIDIDADAFSDTIETYNASAQCGRDPAFGRGGDSYQRHLGDAEHRPNPCVAPIARPPFYALAVFPADLGTAAGLVTDKAARVLASDDRPIPGLYACGNDMNSVMRGAYPGPGITLGPALTFAYLAARDAAGRARDADAHEVAGCTRVHAGSGSS